MHWNEFFSATIGGACTLIGAIIGVLWTDYKNRRKDQDAEEKEVRQFLEAIKTELSSIRERYMLAVGLKIKNLLEEEPFMFKYPVSTEYIVIYKNNPLLVNKVSNDKLREEIIECYIKIIGLIHSFQSNNNLLEKYEEFDQLLLQKPDVEQHSSDPIYRKQQAYLISLKQSAKGIKNLSLEATKNIDSVIKSITLSINTE